MTRTPLVIILLSFSLFLISCSEEEQPTEKFQFTAEIDKVIVMGKGMKRELGRRTIDDTADITIIQEAMHNASVSTRNHTDEGPLFELEVIYKDGSSETFGLKYYISAERGIFYTDSFYYAFNNQAFPAFMELFESFK
ncbi:hypothetical protein MHB42_08145 [Lysinibacillus sp. FSL K6-0232]|uniref:hypothetical protein n=1 Tax=unclassified Lysinibacillus TaxID=2636778 RepID=UPI0030F6B320